MSLLKKHFIISIFFFLLFPFAANAAGTLFFAPASGNYKVGDIFSVLVNMDTGGQSINASTGHITFDQSKLQVASLGYSQSIFTIWTDVPAYSNQTGTIAFSGGIPSPGYNGSSGTVMKITFKVKNSGQASVHFVSGSILANDGNGTNIADGLKGATFTLTSPFEPVPNPAPSQKNVLTEAEKSINAPAITKWPHQLNQGETLTVEGLGYPLSKISVIIQKDSGEWVNGYTFSGFDGQFIFTHSNKVEVGYYTIWARNVVEDGNQSGLSDPVITSVVAPSYIVIYGFVLDYNTIIVILLILLISVILFWILGFFYVRKKKRRNAQDEQALPESLNEKDFGVYVAKELGEHINHELAYLKQIEEFEREKGNESKIVAATLSSIAENLLEEKEKSEGLHPHKLQITVPEISTKEDQNGEKVEIHLLPFLPSVPVKEKEEMEEAPLSPLPTSSPIPAQINVHQNSFSPAVPEVETTLMKEEKEGEKALVPVPDYSEPKMPEPQSETPKTGQEETPVVASADFGGEHPITLSSPHRTEIKE